MTRGGGDDVPGLLDAFRGCHALVVGDAMLDRSVCGQVDRISPEAPVPVVRVRSESEAPGGAANVAANLTALGARVSLIGVRGDDAPGRRLEALLHDGGVDAELLVDGSSRTTVKSRLLAQGRQIVRVDREGDGELAPGVRRRLVERVRGRLAGADVLVLSDYRKGVLDATTLPAILEDAGAGRCPSVVDPKPERYRYYRGATLITPNEAEAAQATGIPIRDDAGCLHAAEVMLQQLEATAVLVTRGARGLLLLQRGAPPAYLPATAREIYDVTGAGDTVVAVMALGLASGAELTAVAALANRAAAVVVGKVGTATVTPRELRRSGRDVARA